MAWRHLVDGGREIWASRYLVDAGWAAAAPLFTTFDGGVVAAGTPAITGDGVGTTTVVWPADRFLWSSRVERDGGWSAAAPIHGQDAGAFPASWPAYPQVAASAAGDLIVVWQQWLTHLEIVAQRWQAGGGWTAASQLTSADAGYAQYPRVGIDPTGNATVVWQEQRGSGMNIFARRIHADAGLGPLSFVAQVSDAGNFAYFQPPGVAVDSAGNVFLSWELADGTVFEGRAFGALGVTVGEVCFNTSMTAMSETLLKLEWRLLRLDRKIGLVRRKEKATVRKGDRKRRGKEEGVARGKQVSLPLADVIGETLFDTVIAFGMKEVRDFGAGA